MLRIIHTGRAYEVLDLLPTGYCLQKRHGLNKLKDEYAALKTRCCQQRTELEQACREIRDLKALLRNTEQELRAKHAILRLEHRQQNDVLGRTCRKVWELKELLENTEQKLRAAELELTRREAEYDQLEEAFDAGWWPERLRARRAEAETEQLRRSLHDERVRRDEWKKMYHQAVMPVCQS